MATWHLHFQPTSHFKVLKNLGSGYSLESQEPVLSITFNEDDILAILLQDFFKFFEKKHCFLVTYGPVT
jgi:hypothetical protein